MKFEGRVRKYRVNQNRGKAGHERQSERSKKGEKSRSFA